jgi:hypothetical protein
MNSFVSPDGSLFKIANFFSTGGGSNCTPTTCLPITGIATTADNQSVYASFLDTTSAQNSQTVRLNPSTLTNQTPTGPYPLPGSVSGMVISQSPEIGAVITKQLGTQVTVNYTAHGNFQEQQNQTFFNES